MKIYVSINGLHYREVAGYWEFWCHDRWEPSMDALKRKFRHGLKLVGNNFRLK